MSEPNPVQPPPFLDVPALLESSQPLIRRGWMAPALTALVLIILGSAYLSSRSPEMEALVHVISIALMFLIAIGMSLLMWMTVRKHREERMRVEAVEELVQLRRWQHAAAALQASLSQPALSLDSRAQMLLFLATVLARYNRFDDAIAIHNHLLETIEPDPGTAHALHLGRAMAMLREDHLVDADRAINELRREVNRAASAAARMSESDESTDGEIKEPVEPVISAGLSLIEMYRDVKTGHPNEAIEMFNRSLAAMRKQLGVRVGDAYALVAHAFHSIADPQKAQSSWESATLLSPAVELTRKYPELRPISEKYHAAILPADLKMEAA